jgi:hypothetical protein
MTFYKSHIITLMITLLTCDVLAFTNTIKTIKPLYSHSSNKNAELVKINQRDIYGILSIISSQLFLSKRTKAFSSKKENAYDELRNEAMNIIDTKEQFTLHSLNTNSNSNSNKDNGNNNEGDNATDATFDVNKNTRIKIEVMLGNIMNNFKENGKNNPEKSISNLQRYCSATNIIKRKNTNGLTASFQDSKYALLLGKFSSYEILDYQKRIDNNSLYYEIDMKVSAPYKTMLQNSIQFNDMYYPKNRDYNNICYVVYRWSLKNYEGGILYLEGCNLVPQQLQI